VSRDYLLLVFFMNQFPPTPEYSIKTVLIFSKIRGDIRKSRCTTGINDTSGKFSAANLPLVSTTTLTANSPPV
jgi:hypothetical protein